MHKVKNREAYYEDLGGFYKELERKLSLLEYEDILSHKSNVESMERYDEQKSVMGDRVDDRWKEVLRALLCSYLFDLDLSKVMLGRDIKLCY